MRLMSSFDSKLAEIHPKTRAGWRSWLERNHAKAPGVWLTYFRATTGKRRLSWEDAVREALCFGWIDSKVKPIDETRYKQVFTPRKPRSVWSRVNKDHVEELIAEGLMTPPGMRAVQTARDSGAWVMLEPVDALIVPPDLEAAFRGAKLVSAAYDALSASEKRSVLYPLYTAKREDTRAKRLAKMLAWLRSRASPR